MVMILMMTTKAAISPTTISASCKLDDCECSIIIGTSLSVVDTIGELVRALSSGVLVCMSIDIYQMLTLH